MMVFQQRSLMNTQTPAPNDDLIRSFLTTGLFRQMSSILILKKTRSIWEKWISLPC